MVVCDARVEERRGEAELTTIVRPRRPYIAHAALLSKILDPDLAQRGCPRRSNDNRWSIDCRKQPVGSTSMWPPECCGPVSVRRPPFSIGPTSPQRNLGSQGHWVVFNFQYRRFRSSPPVGCTAGAPDGDLKGLDRSLRVLWGEGRK